MESQLDTHTNITDTTITTTDRTTHDVNADHT